MEITTTALTKGDKARMTKSMVEYAQKVGKRITYIGFMCVLLDKWEECDADGK